jgi:hypothetical protein
VKHVRGRAKLVFLLLALAALVVGAPVLAQKPPAPTAEELAQYKHHFDTAKKLQQAQAFDVAAGEFEAAYQATKNPQALREALDCYKQTKAAVKATGAARRLLDIHGKELRTREKKDLQALITSLAPSIGAIDLKASETGVEVQIDGAAVGATPLAKPVELDAGVHKLALRKQGFEPFDKEVTVTGERTETVDAALEKEIVSGKVNVNESSGAALDVVVDGKVVGPAPWAGDLALGEHVISGKSATMEAAPKKVTVEKRKPLSIVLVGSATVGKVDIATRDGKGSVTVDGKPVGEGKATVELPVGKHVVAVTRDGYLRVEKLIDVEAGKTVSLTIALEAVKPPEHPNEGVYGGLAFAGLLQAGGQGNQLDRRCADVGGPCTLDFTKGGGVYGHVGYMWNPIGVELLLGLSGDVSSPSAQIPNGTGRWDIYRFGGFGAVRVRGVVQNKAVRAGLALGLGLSERAVGAHSKTTDYLSLMGTTDAFFALRASATTAIALGGMLIVENAGYGAFIDQAESRTPFYLFSGPQFLICPYLGLQFGP